MTAALMTSRVPTVIASTYDHDQVDGDAQVKREETAKAGVD